MLVIYTELDIKLLKGVDMHPLHDEALLVNRLILYAKKGDIASSVIPRKIKEFCKKIRRWVEIV